MIKFLIGSENLSFFGVKVKGIIISFDGEVGVFLFICILKFELLFDFLDYESFIEVMLVVINDMCCLFFIVV